MLELRLFGRFEAVVDGAPLRRLRTHRGQTVLAYLALHAGKAVDRASLAATVWPLSDPSDALYSLRRTLTDLRQALGEYSAALVSPTAATLMLDANRVGIDVQVFEKLSRAEDRVCEAADLYRGELLEGWNDDWIVTHRSHYGIKLRECLLASSQAQDLAGNHRSSAEALQRLLRHEPHNEDLLRMAMERIAKAGEPAAAWALYEAFRKRLEEDLGFSVSNETLRTAESIRERAKTPSDNSVSPVRGFIEPFESSMVGRTNEIEEVERLLATRRLVTLVGLGGIGKTRLAIEVARRIESNFTNGAWFIPLATVREPREVPLTVSAILRPLDPEPQGPVADLAIRLRNVAAVVVLDNCEHVIDAARDICRSFRAHCPQIRFLATSQQPIGLEHERLFSVPVLGVSPMDEAKADSVTLFCERARMANPNIEFEGENLGAIERICQRLEGIPLAIELAASRVRFVEPSHLDELLGKHLELLSSPSASRDPRHSTLDATLAWSFDHLKEPEQAALMAAATFVGTWSVDDLSTVMAAPSLTTVNLLEPLVERSLVIEAGVNGRPRFRLLDPVRQFAVRRAEQTGMSETFLRRHTDMFLAMCEQAAAGFSSGNAGNWHATLMASEDEISAAYNRAIQLGNARDALLFSANTWRYIWNRGLLQLGRDRAERVISLSGADGYGLEYWDALHVAGLFAWSQAEFQLAADRIFAAKEGYRQVDNDEGLGRATGNLGQVLRNQGRTYESELLFAEAMGIWRRMGHQVRVILSISDLGISAFEQCRYEDSLQRFAEAKAAAESSGAESTLAGIDLNEGQTLHELGRWDEAHRAFDRARQRAVALNIVVFEIMTDYYRGFLQLTQGEHLAAARGFLSGIERFIQVGEVRGLMLSIEALGLVASEVGDRRTGGLLIGAAEAMRTARAIVRTPIDERRFARHTAGIGGAEFDAAFERGRVLSRHDVVKIGTEFVAALT